MNESEVFKTPSKLPALLYFKRVDTPDGEVDFVKECYEFDDVRNHMVLDSTEEKFEAAMKEFIAKAHAAK